MKFSTLIFTLVLFFNLASATSQQPTKKEKSNEPSESAKIEEKDKTEKQTPSKKSSFGEAIFPFFFYPVLTDTNK